MSEQSNSGRVLIIILIVVFILGGVAGFWYFFVYQPEQEAKERARLEQIAREKAEQEQKELEAQNKLKYDQLIIDADSAFAGEDWDNARLLYTDALSLFPDETYPRDQLATVNAKLDEVSFGANTLAGAIETISTPTGRFYVIISSSVDDDLAMDYAKKLSVSGIPVKIIEHKANNLSFYGVSMGDYASWDQAVSASAEFSSYGDGVWVLKN